MAGKEGVSVPLNWCVFNGFDSVLHDTFSTDLELLRVLPNVYAVCIARRNSNPKTIVGGFFVRTTYTDDDDPEFSDALANAMAAVPAFREFAPELHSFLPARVSAPLDITEDEMLKVLFSQKLKFTTGGNA
ncbi:hypothetical protein ACFQUU_21605 [Herbaspirillum sp. GCM10030257]|uniref:hypothetical protein n=1 Tax=Herbaspirillum sp. GCM10030257 TaxID=3273393 RepID=UPI003605DCE6